jgi:glutamine amidotransferase-like uncharacterized protein
MHIKIYNGLGVSKESLVRTFNTFSAYSNDVSYISPYDIIEGDLDIKVLVMPGGADKPYADALNGEGNRQIKQFVNDGGCFIGICAGAYYAGESIEFAQGSSIEVCETRELGFYPGCIVGPLHKYYYHSNKGARAKKINFNQNSIAKTCYVFYNGGGYFSNITQALNTEVIAYYDNNKPAIVKRKVGKGIAILSGVHFEYDPFTMKPSKITDKLKIHNSSRIELINHIFSLII